MNRKASRVPLYPCVTQLHTRGTFYDVGYNVGLNFSQRIKLFFAESDNIQDKLLPFYDTQAGRDYYEESLRVAQDCYPHYVREVRGISDGAGLPFEHVFMANVSKEVYNVLFKERKSNEKGIQDQRQNKVVQDIQRRPESAPFQEDFGCSDVFLNRPGYQYVVHNEDCDPMIKPYGYLLSADIEEDGRKEQFTSFCYPGFLPGCAFSFNVHGLTISINGLYPDHVVRVSHVLFCRDFNTRWTKWVNNTVFSCSLFINCSDIYHWFTYLSQCIWPLVWTNQTWFFFFLS